MKNADLLLSADGVEAWPAGSSPGTAAPHSRGLWEGVRPGVCGFEPNGWAHGSRTKDSYSRASLCDSMRRNDLPDKSLKSIEPGPGAGPVALPEKGSENKKRER